MVSPIKVAILEDHQSIIDGYHMRLDEASGIEVVGIANNGEELNTLLKEKLELDVLNENPIPILHYVPRILADNPNLNILIVSMYTQPSLIKALSDVGVSGYIFKTDSDSIRRLPAIIKSVATGGRYFSDHADDTSKPDAASKQILTTRQLEILTYCASYPDLSTEQIALELGIASSSVRNMLSETYDRLNVHTKAAAITKARLLGLIP
jgi:two-component system nitrate/nitrite response regulator NarL